MVTDSIFIPFSLINLKPSKYSDLVSLSINLNQSTLPVLESENTNNPSLSFLLRKNVASQIKLTVFGGGLRSSSVITKLSKILLIIDISISNSLKVFFEC